VYPDVCFIPLYLLSAGLLLLGHWLGSILAFVAGGGFIYVMIYLLAFREFEAQ
jgi:ABC-type glycerol-3-phosphate transport system permease component